ncbi:MAG: methyl-accepting chemotaxis protein, partial [Thermotoga sp.]
MKSVRGKLLLGFGAVIVIVTLLCALTLFNLSSVRRVVESTRFVNDRVFEIALAKSDVLVAVQMKNEEKLKQALSDLDKTAKDIKANLKSYSKRNREILEQAISEIETLINSVKSVDLEHFDEALYTSIISKAERINDVLRKVVENLDVLQVKQLRNANVQVYIWGIVAVVFALVITFITTQSLIKPVRKVMTLIDNISNGVLNIEIEKIKSRDEIGRMAQSVEKLRGILLDVLTTVNKATNDLSATSEELSATTQNVSADLNDLANSMNSISKEAEDNSASLEEITANIEEFASAADSNAKSAQDMLS